MHRLARDDAGRLHVDTGALVSLDRAFAVDRIAECVDNTAKETFADRYVHDRAGALDGLAFLNLAVVAEDHDADVVDFEVERHATHTVLELDHLAGLHIVETVGAGNAVADGKHLADLGDLSFLAEVLDLLFQDGGNFCGADVHQRASFIANLIELSLVRSELSTMRLPTLTIKPPMMVGSILTSRSMSLPPVTDFRVLLSVSRLLSFSFSATVTCAVTSPLCRATRARKARIMSRTANSRRLVVMTLRKLAASPLMSALARTADRALSWSSASNAGLRTRRLRSALSATSASN